MTDRPAAELLAELRLIQKPDTAVKPDVVDAWRAVHTERLLVRLARAEQALAEIAVHRAAHRATQDGQT